MKLTRKELYDLVWKEPMTTVCKRFGITDNGLRKHCKSMNIPTPPAGYWAKLKHGKNPKKIPLPSNLVGKKQSTELREVDPSKQVVDFSPANDRYETRELEIQSGDTSYFVVPDVLYAKEPIIIDTKEAFRKKQDNQYLQKNPYKSKRGPTLDIYVSEKSIERVLSIFWTIIKALRFRGHNIKIADNHTYALIENEEIQISISERKKRNPNSENPYDNRNNVFCGELHFNIYFEYRGNTVFKDTLKTKLEDKIIQIVANLEIRSEKIKEERIEEERIEEEKRRIIREKEERERKQFESKRKEEYNEFKSLFSMAERLHKTNILRQYISSYEDFIFENGLITDEIKQKIEWAKEKADWLDPFIKKEDKYLDYYDKDEIIQQECPNKNTWGYSSYYSSPPKESFWSSPFRKWK